LAHAVVVALHIEEFFEAHRCEDRPGVDIPTRKFLRLRIAGRVLNPAASLRAVAFLRCARRAVLSEPKDLLEWTLR
jgi:hypothetical protein